MANFPEEPADFSQRSLLFFSRRPEPPTISPRKSRSGGFQPPIQEAPSAMPKTPIPFRGFEERAEVKIYDHGILPHWRLAGCTYFVTFRLADSLPTHVLQELEKEKSQWLKAHGIDLAD